MKRDLLHESREAVGILDYTLKQIHQRQQRFGYTPNTSEVAELYNALARALNIVNRLSSQSLRPEEYSAEAIRKLLD